jgi:hypothetical protein
LVPQEASCPTDNPAVVRQAFPASLPETAPVADGVNQFNPLRVNTPQDGGRGQEDLGPVLMGHAQPTEPGALGEPGKEPARVLHAPTIQGAVPHACEGMQEPQGHHFTRP